MSTQPLVELQINASAFLSAQLLGLQAQKITFPGPIQVGTVQVVVDHVEFGANRLDHSVRTEEFIYHVEPVFGKVVDRVEGRKVLIVQPITVFLADLADVMSHPNQPPSQLIPVQATFFIRLLYFADTAGQDQFQSTLDHAELAPLPPLPPGIDGNALQQQFQAFAGKLAPPTTFALGLAGKATGGEGSVQVVNLGISVDQDLTRIALRQELGTGIPQDPAIWQAFFLGDVPDHLQGAGYAVFLSGVVLEDLFRQQISTGLESSKGGEFELVSGVGATYSAVAGQAKLGASFSGNVDASLCTVWADVFVDGVMSVDTPNIITIDVNLGFELATSACLVTAALLGAAIGLVANFVVPLGGLIVDPILGSMAGIAGTVFFAGTMGPGHQSVPDCDQQSDTHLVCTRSVPAISTPLGKLNFQSLIALGDGVVLAGQLLAVPVGTPQLKIDPDQQFTYLPPVAGCGQLSGHEVDDFTRNPKAHIRVIAGVNITAGSLAPIYLLDAKVVNDPLGVFANPLEIQGTQALLSITIADPYPGDRYFEAPYPCQILVSTTGGERLVSIAPPPPLTQRDIDRMTAQLEEQIGSCFELVDNFFRFGAINPKWLVDPGPGDRIVDHFYEVEINGLRGGEAAVLLDAADRAFVTGVATRNRTLRMSAVVAPAETAEIGVIRVRREGGGLGKILDSVVSVVEGGEEDPKRGRAYRSGGYAA